LKDTRFAEMLAEFEANKANTDRYPQTY
jgi:hypothetical protein